MGVKVLFKARNWTVGADLTALGDTIADSQHYELGFKPTASILIVLLAEK